MVESMTSGVKSVQHQCSMHNYKVLPVFFNTSFCFSSLAASRYSYLVENVLSFNLVCHMCKSVKNVFTNELNVTQPQNLTFFQLGRA